MASPLWTKAPAIHLAGNTIVVDDRGDWFEVGGGTVDRFCLAVRLDGTIWAQEIPSLREKPEDASKRFGYWADPAAVPLVQVQPGWQGRTAQVAVFGGFLFHGWGDSPGDWVEWGRENANDHRQPNLSNAVQIPRPPIATPPPEPLVVGLLRDAEREAAASLAVKLGWRRSVNSLHLIRQALDELT